MSDVHQAPKPTASADCGEPARECPEDWKPDTDVHFAQNHQKRRRLVPAKTLTASGPFPTTQLNRRRGVPHALSSTLTYRYWMSRHDWMNANVHLAWAMVPTRRGDHAALKLATAHRGKGPLVSPAELKDHQWQRCVS